MYNQADNLRLMAKLMQSNLRSQIHNFEKIARVITITSGKGGVGKSSLSVNLGLALLGYNKRVVILDADLGLANIDVILGITPEFNLSHVVNGEKNIQEIIYTGPQGLKVIPGGSGMHEMANLENWQLDSFLDKLNLLEEQVDFLLIDTGAGLSKNVLSFALAADEILLLTTPEPTAITDAYGFIKTLRKNQYRGDVRLVVNRVTSETEATIVYSKLKTAGNRFLRYNLEYQGYIREDPKVGKAVQEQNPFLLAYPSSAASHDIYNLAAKICEQQYSQHIQRGVKGFFTKVAELFR